MVAYPVPSSPAVTAVMRGNRKRDTRPEVAVRSALHRRGLRFRKDVPLRAGDLRVRADIVFPRRRLVVFVDGCFWHRCPDHGTSPRANTAYWGPKLDRNVERDRLQGEALRADGWTVVRAWEHEDPAAVADAVSAILEAQRAVRPT